MTGRRSSDPVDTDGAFERRLQEAARSLAPEALPDEVLDARLVESDPNRTWRLTALASVGVLVVALSAFAIRSMQVATATPTPSMSTTISQSPNPTATASVSPQPSAPTVAVTADLILGGSGLEPNVRSSCSNGPDGYSLTVPDGWYTNRARDGIRACQFFDDQPYNLGEVVHSVIRIQVQAGSLNDLLLARDKGNVFEDKTIDLGDGVQARRRTYLPESSPRVAYYVSLAGPLPSPEVEARYLVATLDDFERYDDAAPILEKIVDSLAVSDPWRPHPTRRNIVDALFANTKTCAPAGGEFAISFPASWATGSNAGQCTLFGPGSSALGQVQVEVSDGAFGTVESTVGNEDLVVSGYPGHRLESISDLHQPDPGVKNYQYIVYLGDGRSLGPNLSLSTGNRFGGDYEVNAAVLDRMVSTIRIRNPDADFAAIPYSAPTMNTLYQVAGTSGRITAVSQNCTTTGNRCRNLIWTSTDGLHWSSPGAFPAPKEFSLEAMAAGPNGWVALAGGHAWFSPNGTTWEGVDGSAFVSGQADGGPVYQAEGGCCGADPAAVIATRNGYVAVGAVTCFKCHGRAAVWLSADGHAWRRVPYQSSFEAGPMNDVVELPGGRLVAAGLGAWTSDDGGQTWKSRNLSGEEASVAALLDGDKGLVAIANAIEGTKGIVFTSADGAIWKTNAPAALNSLYVTAATFWNGAVIVAANDYSQFVRGEEPLVMLEESGTNWHRLVVGPDNHGRINRFVALKGMLLALGGRPQAPGIWVHN
jgi:hypothetical protein